MLLSRLLDKDPKTRITITEALEHRWLQKSGSLPTTSLTFGPLAGIDKAVAMDELHKAILAVMGDAALKSCGRHSLQKQFREADADRDGKAESTQLKGEGRA